MSQRRTTPKQRPRAADDLMHGLRELAAAVASGVPLEEQLTVRTVSIPQPHEYSSAAVKRLRHQLGMSQAAFAEALGVSRIWVQGWERGVRRPSPLARRLMDTIRTSPAAWVATVLAKTG